MRRTIAVGTRASKLAIIQAESVVAKLKEVVPGLDARLVKIVTRGDRESTAALDKFAGQGVFVRELERALLDSKIDVAVHSLKDLPTEIPGRLSLAAVTARLDPRDVLVSRAGSLADLAPGSKIGTGSLRRSVQLLAYRSDLEICEIRGNIDTRLGKVTQGEFDGVIIAAAALIRLGWEDKITEYLPADHFVPAVGQGALGLEIRSDDTETAELVSQANHEPTWQSVTAERAFLQALGGGCRAPIAALGIVSGVTLRLDGMVAGASGGHILRGSEEGDALAPEKVGTCLAQKMVEMGAPDLMAEAETQ